MTTYNNELSTDVAQPKATTIHRTPYTNANESPVKSPKTASCVPCGIPSRRPLPGDDVAPDGRPCPEAF